MIFWGLGLAAVAIGAALTRYGRNDNDCEFEPRERPYKTNPLEMTLGDHVCGDLPDRPGRHPSGSRAGSATRVCWSWPGIMGAADVDPFILGSHPRRWASALDVGTAALAVIIASAR